jgi:putative salt-induced outer membrane protein YdiY
MNQVTGLVSDKDFKVKLDSGNTLVGQLDKQGNKRVMHTTLGTIDISEDPIVGISEKGKTIQSTTDSSATVKHEKASKSGDSKQVKRILKPEWDYEGSIDISGKTGNTERFATSATLQALRSTDDENLKFYAAIERVKENGEETSNELIGGLDFERILGKRHSWYARVELGKDEIENVDLRTEAALGYGYYFLKKKNHQLRGRIGSLFRHESFDNDTDEQALGIDLAMRNEWDLTTALRMLNELVYTPSLEDMGDYRITHSSSLETPLQFTDGDLRLRLGVSNEYDSRPAEGVEMLDTSYFTRLVFGW